MLVIGLPIESVKKEQIIVENYSPFFEDTVSTKKQHQKINKKDKEKTKA